MAPDCNICEEKYFINGSNIDCESIKIIYDKIIY